MFILGIDPGLAATGWAVLEKANPPVLVDYGCIKTNKEDNFAERLLQIADFLKEIIDQYQPAAMAIEELFFAKNVKTAIKVAQVAGVIKLTGRRLGLTIFEYTPLNIKITITGYGRADKKQLEIMVGKLLRLKKTIHPNHAADAVAVGLTHCFTNRKLK
jgi:crossover junction endodeoxyribonuclease RuvC